MATTLWKLAVNTAKDHPRTSGALATAVTVTALVSQGFSAPHSASQHATSLNRNVTADSKSPAPPNG